MLKSGSVCQGCKDKWLNQDKEPKILRVLGSRTTKLGLEVFYCTHCDSGDNGQGIHEFVERSKSS